MPLGPPLLAPSGYYADPTSRCTCRILQRASSPVLITQFSSVTKDIAADGVFVAFGDAIRLTVTTPYGDVVLVSSIVVIYRFAHCPYAICKAGGNIMADSPPRVN